MLFVHIKARWRIIINQAAFRLAAPHFWRGSQRSAPGPSFLPWVKDPPVVISKIGPGPHWSCVATRPNKTLRHSPWEACLWFPAPRPEKPTSLSFVANANSLTVFNRKRKSQKACWQPQWLCCNLILIFHYPALIRKRKETFVFMAITSRMLSYARSTDKKKNALIGRTLVYLKV